MKGQYNVLMTYSVVLNELLSYIWQNYIFSINFASIFEQLPGLPLDSNPAQNEEDNHENQAGYDTFFRAQVVPETVVNAFDVLLILQKAAHHGLAGEWDDLEDKLVYHWTDEEYLELQYNLEELITQESQRVMEQYWRDQYPECKFTRIVRPDDIPAWLVIEYLTDDTRLPYASEHHEWQSFSFQIMQNVGICSAADAISRFGSTIKRGYEK